MKLLSPKFCLKLFFASAFLAPLSFAEINLEEVIVTSDFREAQLKNIPTSISVIDADIIQQRNSRHLEDLLSLTPNVNFASGSSRGRYFQIRGIGERSQFVAPLNPSVGTYVDGIDFTGFGGAATLLDIAQVEVLRGSQGTRFGANALAGVINLKSADPSTENQGYFKSSASSYNGFSVDTAVGGSLNNQWSYRAAIGKTTSDGFINNTTLNKKDTNNIDELTSRIKLRWLKSEDLSVDFTALHLDIDNGYDAFSLDENRNTMSDQPGHDRQKSTAFAINSYWDKSAAVTINTILTSNRTDTEYGYDEDWSYVDFWLNNWEGENIEKYTNGEAIKEYQGFDNYSRDVARDTIEIRLLSGPDGKISNSDWLLGVYYQDSDMKLNKNYFGIYRGYSKYGGPNDVPNYFAYDTPAGESIFNSEYTNSSLSLFAQSETPLANSLSLVLGLRYEKWKSNYKDSDQINGKNDEDLMGGKVVLELTTEADNLLYLSLTRGYKAGGFNAEPDLPNESDMHFDTEYQWNYELGGKFNSPDGKISNHITAFYTDRKDLQLKSSAMESDGVGWIDFTTNAGKGYSYGLEWEMTWQIQDNLKLASSLGLLKTKITEHRDSDPNAFNLENRAAAHAPEYSYATSVNYDLSDKLTAILEVQGKDKFYYSDSHNYQSQNYNLVNARLVYSANDFELSAYVNNATDKDYGVRGFNFGDWDQDPRSGKGFDEAEFQQLGSPKVIGMSVRAAF